MTVSVLWFSSRYRGVGLQCVILVCPGQTHIFFFISQLLALISGSYADNFAITCWLVSSATRHSLHVGSIVYSFKEPLYTMQMQMSVSSIRFKSLLISVN